MRFTRISSLIAGVSLSLVGAAPAVADEIPPEWGAPAYEDGSVALVARADGRVQGIPGNQHVIFLRSSDEEPIIGQIVHWRCPRGIVAPEDPSEDTRCREKARHGVDFDAEPGWFVKKWSPTLRWLALRAPVSVTDETGVVVDRGVVSLRVKGTGATTVSVEEEFHEAYVYREGGRVVSGKFLGLRWRSMADVRIDDLSLYRYYDVPAPS